MLRKCCDMGVSCENIQSVTLKLETISLNRGKRLPSYEAREILDEAETCHFG
jgi:hypothetical protein